MLRGRLLICSSLLVVACGGPPADEPEAVGASTGIRLLGDPSADEFRRASSPREMRFPDDHGAHPEFRTEWWYFTGNLRDPAQRHYGFELTFFRLGLAASKPARASAWGASEMWMAHFAITDSSRGRFTASERLARGALGLAGADAEPLRIWVKDWSAEGLGEAEHTKLRLQARDAETALELTLETTKAPVLQGDRGLDAKGPEPGNASFYYSLPRLTARGSLLLDGESIDVSGFAWMDREWSTSALSDGVVGWDWFALQLSDGRDLMFYRLRNEDGTATPFSGGSLVDAGGAQVALGPDDVALAAIGEWTSPQTGVRYPVRWHLEVPSAGIDLDIDPYIPNQELNLSVRYWEGAVRGVGRVGTEELRAEGYLELAGY
jgi:predicted secreted hydrolase